MQQRVKVWVGLVALGLLTLVWRTPASAQFCVGDCNNDTTVSITELLNGIKIALEQESVDACDLFDGVDFDGAVTIEELVSAVRNSGNECAGPPWEFQNPAPAGDDLYAVSFVDAQNGWAVGDFGNILNTTDGGATWQLGILDVALFGVKFISTQVGWAVGDGGVIIRTTDGGETWIDQDSGTTQPLNAVTFLDANTGWTVGLAGTIRKTTNGGETWTAQTSPRNVSLNAMHFVDAQTGWIVGESGAILHTSNGGDTWVTQPSRTATSLFAVTFVDATRGFAAGDDGVVLSTTNGGASWDFHQPSGLPGVDVGTTPLLGIHFIDALNGWIVGDIDLDENGTGEGVILRTADGGNTWVRQSSGNDNALFAVTFVGQTGFAVGASGTLLRALDGETWTLQNPGPTNILFAIAFTAGGSNGYAVGDLGAVGRTIDGGFTWLSKDWQEGDGLFAVSSVQADSSREFGDWAWAAGANGTVIFTRSGGTAWERQTTPTDLPLFGIKFVDLSNGWAVGLDGVIIRTSNGGLTWSEQTSNSPDCDGFPCSLFAVSFADPQNGIAVGDAGVILRTNNGGTSWAQQNSGTTQPLFGVSCANTQTCWAVGGFQDESNPTQEILRTTNGGTTWSRQTAPSIALAALFAVSAADTQNVWAVGDSGIIIATNNGGTTWEFQESGSGTLLNGVAFTSPQDGWIAGDTGLILHTSTGGRLE